MILWRISTRLHFHFPSTIFIATINKMKIASLAFSIILSLTVVGQAADSSKFENAGLSRDTVGIFEKVEVEAAFPGGLDAWRNFLVGNLNGDKAAEGVPKRKKNFQQTALVQFIVCTDGTICNIKVKNKVLPSIKKEAERVISLSGQWLPAEQNGKKVKAYRMQPITFVISSE
jgi:hypothetical protein